jgi:hypothetical protein
MPPPIGSRAPSVLLFLLLLLPYAYFNDGTGWNQRSRLAELHAVVIQRSVNIDFYHEVTGDKALVNGHYYSEKAPAIAFLALPAFAVTVAAQRVLGVDPDREAGWEFSQWLTTACSVSLLAALGGVAFFSLLRRSMSPHRALAGTLAVFLGTLTWPYATALFAHSGTIGLLSIAMWCVLDEEGRSRNRDLLGGLCAGLAVAAEYPAVFAAGGLAVILVLADWKRALRFCLAALPAALLIMLKNYVVTGNPLTLSYGSNPEFPVETAANHFGHRIPGIDDVTGVLFSEYRGLFFWSPVLLMAVPGLVKLARTARPVAIVIVAVFLLQLVQVAGFYRWFGGNSIGARYLSPAIPFLGFAAAHGIDRFPKAGAALTAVSVALMAMVTAIDIAPVGEVTRPLMEIYLPRVMEEGFAKNLGTALGLPPLTSLDVLAVLMVAIGMQLGLALEAPSGDLTRTAASPPDRTG